MAMLMLNDVFSGTWGSLAGEVPPEEYWKLITTAVRQEFPGFIFIAEALLGHGIHPSAERF